MPLYDYDCKTCKDTQELFADIQDRDGQTCTACGSGLDRQWTPPSKGLLVFNPYWDNGLGRRVESKKHRKEICKELKLEPQR